MRAEKELDQAQIDGAVLALLAIHSFGNGRSWKGLDWTLRIGPGVGLL